MQFGSSKVGQTKWEKYMWKLEGKKKHSGAMAFIMNTGPQYIPETSTAQIRSDKSSWYWCYCCLLTAEWATEVTKFIVLTVIHLPQTVILIRAAQY